MKIGMGQEYLKETFRIFGAIRNEKRKAGMALNAPCIVFTCMIDFEIPHEISAVKDIFHALNMKRWVVDAGSRGEIIVLPSK